MDKKLLEKALSDLREGKVIVVADDEKRENEGDLICASENVTGEVVNFMAKYGRGLICMPISEEIAKRLCLNPMVNNNTDNHETAFTVSIDHKDTTTGISADERALTARMCASDDCDPNDLRRPGHLFPLVAKNGGVIERQGHTEATVDLLKLAGLKECGLCCEIMKDDGSMMREGDLKDFAKEHDLTYITVADIAEYRKIYDNLVECVSIANMPTK